MKKFFVLSSLILASLGFATEIHEIQGLKHVSEYVNKDVKDVKGVVTAIRNTRYNHGFFMQSLNPDNDNRTSEGIYVETKSEVKIGDLVDVSGIVKEIQFTKRADKELTITSIYADSVKVLSTNHKVKPTIINARDIPTEIVKKESKTLDVKDNAKDYYESLEGMYVEIENPYITGLKEKYGEITVVPDNGKYIRTKTNNGGIFYSYSNPQTQRIIILDDLIPLRKKDGTFIDKNFTPNPGDKFSAPIYGVISYSYGNYKLYNTEKLPKIIDSGAKVDTPKFKYNKDMLNIVSYNIENFNRFEKGRKEELAKQILTKLQTPDVIGLIEVEDNDGDIKSNVTSASENLQALIDEIKKMGGPEYAYIDIAPNNLRDGGKPGVNIQNAILYRKDRLELVKGITGTSDVDTKPIKVDGKFRLSLNPGKLGTNSNNFESVRKSLVANFKFMGKDIIVIVNHLQSKRSDDPLYGVKDKAVENSEENRTKQGELVNNFVKEVLAINPNVTIVSMGDMNDFEFSPTLKAMQGKELISVINLLPLNERHTYVHQGNSQVLDHILINTKYAKDVNIDVLNINSEFTESQGAFSDHDPVFIQFKVK